jgi:hypothetical protein
MIRATPLRRRMEEALTIEDGAGTRYPPRKVAWKLADTIVRSLLLVGVLYAIGLTWEAFA